MSLRRPSWPKSAQVTTREVHANAPCGRGKELVLGEGGAEGGAEGICMEYVWNMHGNMHGMCMVNARNKYGICVDMHGISSFCLSSRSESQLFAIPLAQNH